MPAVKKKSVPAGRRSRQRGAALMVFSIIFVLAALAYLLSSLGPDLSEARRERLTHDALAQAREALIGYALKYRETQPDHMYGYLPLPDLGNSRNNNVGCTQEGCDANTFTGAVFDANGIGPSVVGRFPWRTLGTEPLRDGHGECLWLMISSLHSRIQRTAPPPVLPPMNADTLGQFDIVVANSTSALVSALTGPHERPVAVIFSPGPPLPGQDRKPSGTDNVTVCGGNYDARNYLDPANAAALGGVTNYLSGDKSASGSTGDSDPSNDPNTPKRLSTRGKVFATGGNFVAGGCEGNDCALLANDNSLVITPDSLFSAIRKNANFRTDINSMLDRMTNCLRDKFVAGGFAPAAIDGYTPPAGKLAGRIPYDACYDGSKVPLGYYDHYKEMLFVAKPSGVGSFTVNSDAGCAGTLVFANQRGAGQQRVTSYPAYPLPVDKGTLLNYLEGNNLAGFTGPGTTFGSVGGPTLLDRSPPQAVEQDIARCVPADASFTTVTSPTLGVNQLAAYDAGTRILTLGRQDITTGFGYNANALFGCAWFSESRSLGGGIRSYFKFQFMDVEGSVGLNGFVFALADAARNTLNACGAGGSHLGYSGKNTITPKIDFPKIGIEFDQSRNPNFSETNVSVANPGRNDPCYATSCPGGTYSANSHVAIVYWGHEIVTADSPYNITQPDFDDNAHGLPTATFAAGTPPRPPRNPDASPGIAFKDLRQKTSMGGNSYSYHVRIEVTPVGRSVNSADGRLSNTAVRTEAWIDSSPTPAQLDALKNVTRPISLLAPGYPATLTDTVLMYDVPLPASTCDIANPCPAGQGCGSDNMCYRPALQTVQLGFTGSQRTSDQKVEISDFFTTWLP
ncbi:MAG: hypothetical protein HKUEN07_29640 [Rhodocyclaceae bacterium]|nr:MAG: hypothetical protein HKUEN07_29640 [Rhodocyclaceae bacterium]